MSNIEIPFENFWIEEKGSKYISAAVSDNTKLSYQGDINRFVRDGHALPTTPEEVASYLVKSANNYNPRTLKRQLTSIGQWHSLQGMNDPTKSPLVVKTMSGIFRMHGVPKKQAYAIRMSDLRSMVRVLDKDTSIRSMRDRSIILLGFFGAFRRSELVSLDWDRVHFESDGIVIKLGRSKTDQMGSGSTSVIPAVKEPLCPIRALIDWRQACGVYEGPLFRAISKTGNVLNRRLGGKSINNVIQAIAKEAGLAQWESVSSHSLRRGFATESARLGASLPAIQRHGRWRSVKTVVEYIEAGRQFKDSAVNALLLG